MRIKRESMHELMEMVDEAKQSVQEARVGADEETRKEKIQIAESALRRLASLMEEPEA